MKRIAVLLGVLLAVTYVSPAVGGPDLTAKIRKIDQREKRHYDSLDRRVKALALLSLEGPSTSRSTAAMTADASGHFYTGTAYCSRGRVTGGGASWWPNTIYADYRVQDSAPARSGEGWAATVYTGGSPSPSVLPTVYAICEY